MLVKEIMTKDVVTVTMSTKLAETAKLMLKYRISGVPVVNENNEVIEMVTKADIVQRSMPSAIKIIGSDSASLFPQKEEEYLKKLKVLAEKDVASVVSHHGGKIFNAAPDNTIAQVAFIMYANDVRRLPVVNEEKELVGIISYSDIASIVANS